MYFAYVTYVTGFRSIPKTVTQSPMLTWKTSTTTQRHSKKMIRALPWTAFRRWTQIWKYPVLGLSKLLCNNKL